jgi:hypothetical protein
MAARTALRKAIGERESAIAEIRRDGCGDLEQLADNRSAYRGDASLETVSAMGTRLPFQFLDCLARLTEMIKTAPSNAFQTDAIRFEKAKASELDGGGPFKLSFCECESVSDGDVIGRRECTMPASVSNARVNERISCLFLDKMSQ